MKRGRKEGARLLMVTLAVGCMVLVLMGPQWRDEVRAQESAGPACTCDCTGAMPRVILNCGKYTVVECDAFEGKPHNRSKPASFCLLGNCTIGTDTDCPPPN